MASLVPRLSDRAKATKGWGERKAAALPTHILLPPREPGDEAMLWHDLLTLTAVSTNAESTEYQYQSAQRRLPVT